ncbi:outer membrane protein A [Psychromonas sp. CNPT3]|uniref:outer membrane beta-barrel protein n=1 Tax=Psychromonas sp. CNPT3 TaxID=314282 RepID=UPI0002C0A620|nr:outer membrane beta-barrel protein [Psychromonas sp. CNPT3]AGH82327.1 outer membrane protein A [Psychromonas sp. CNPT3]
MKHNSPLCLMNNTKILIAICPLLPFFLQAAENNTNNFYIGAKAGWSKYQDACLYGYTKCEEDSLGYGLFVGYDFTDWFAIEGGVTNHNEVNSSYQNYDVEALAISSDLSTKFGYRLTDNVQLYTKVGISYQHINKTMSDLGDFSGSSFGGLVAMGIDYKLDNNWSLRGEYQFIDGIGDDTSLKADLHFTSVGIKYRFSSSKQKDIIPITQPKETVVSEIKKQPKLPKNIILFFDFDSSEILPTPLLHQITDQLAKFPKINISIIAHTDSEGSDLYNDKLAAKRALEVSKYFLHKNINKNRINVLSHGERLPTHDNETKKGRAKNRRVEITFSHNA